MWKNILILAVLISFSSCGSKKTTTGKEASSKEAKAIKLGKQETVVYNSLGNDIASISLKLYENETFILNLESLPEPGTKDKRMKIAEKGTYTSEGDWKTLNFKKPKFSVAAVFDKKLASPSDFQIIDANSVKINTAKNTLSIWGIVCEKE